MGATTWPCYIQVHVKWGVLLSDCIVYVALKDFDVKIANEGAG